MIRLRIAGVVISGTSACSLLLLGCAAPTPAEAPTAAGAAQPESKVEPPRPAVGEESAPVDGDLVAQLIERDEFSVLAYCWHAPPAIVELSTPESGCELPGNECTRNEYGQVIEHMVGRERARGVPRMTLGYAYDDYGHLAKTSYAFDTICQTEITKERDEYGRIVRELTDEGCTGKPRMWTRYTYDEAGRVVVIEAGNLRDGREISQRERTLSYGGEGRLLGTTEGGVDLTLEYDEHGQCVAYFDGRYLIRRYERGPDGVVTASQDDLFRATFQRDAQGRIVRKTVEPLYGDEPEPEVIEYRYDESGICIGMARAEGKRSCEFETPFWGSCDLDFEPDVETLCSHPY